jgi:hypothetical protein
MEDIEMQTSDLTLATTHYKVMSNLAQPSWWLHNIFLFSGRC